MIATPHTYAEWASVLNILKKGTDDEDVLKAMKAGTVEWQSGVAERFSKRLIDTINARMNVASDKFQTDLSRARGQEGAIVHAILTLRKEMSFLVEAISLPALPDDERERYRDLVIDQANNMQRSLEDSAKNDRSGRLASIVRNHRVNSF